MSYLARKALPHPVPPSLTSVGEEESIYLGYGYEELPNSCPIVTGVADGTQNPGADR